MGDEQEWKEFHPRDEERNHHIQIYWSLKSFIKRSLDDNNYRLFIIQLQEQENYEIWHWHAEHSGNGDRFDKLYKCLSTHDTLPAAKAAYRVIACALGLVPKS
jgi:hypothetical protein